MIETFMNDADVKYLQSLKRSAKNRMVLMCVAAVVPLIVFGIVAFTQIPYEERKQVMWFILPLFVISLSFMAFMLTKTNRYIKRIDQDLREARKTSIKVELKNKRKSSRKRTESGSIRGKGRTGRFYYLITSEGRWIEVSEQSFHTAPENGSATLVLAPVSQTVLDVGI